MDLELVIEAIAFLFYIPIIFFWYSKHLLFIKFNNNSIILPILVVLALEIILIIIFLEYNKKIIFYPGENIKQIAIILIGFSIVIDVIALYQLARKFNLNNKAPELVNDGIYKFIKHPIYLSHLNFTLSSFFFTGTFLALVAAFAWLINYPVLRKIEEKELSLRFGKNYIEYAKNKLL